MIKTMRSSSFQTGVFFRNPRSYRVFLGARNLNNLEAARSFSIERMVIHPRYTGGRNFSYDVAILRLDRTVTFTDNISPICLPQNDAPVDETCYVSGWGSTISGRPYVRQSHLISNSNFLLFRRTVKQPVARSSGPYHFELDMQTK